MSERKWAPQEIMEALKDDETLGKYIIKFPPVAPTPEVEPVAFIDTFSNRLVWPGQICTNSEGRMTPLYTHPAPSDELRKAAEEAYLSLLALSQVFLNSDENKRRGQEAAANLRAALEKK